MTVKTMTDEEWAAVWRGPETARAISQRLGVSSQTVDYHFRMLRSSGLVPNVRRKRTRISTRPARPRRERLKAQEAREIQDEVLSVGHRDPLLEALRRVHGDDPRRALDTVHTLAGAATL